MEGRPSAGRIKRIALWAAAAAAAALVLELFFYLSLTAPAARARLLGALPDGIEARYIGFVLGDGDGYFRNAARKCEMIGLLGAARDGGIRLSYDPAALFPYAGNRAVRAYRSSCLEEPTRPRAGRLLFGLGDEALLRRAFAAHAGDPASIGYLCRWFDAANLHFAGYKPLLRRHCSPLNTVPEAWSAAARP